MADDIPNSSPSEGPDPTDGLGYMSTGDHDDAIARRIGEWAKRLLQLDRRNNLLYFKPGRSAVGITSVAPNQLDERLRRSRRGLEFPYASPAQSRRRGFATQDNPDHTDAPAVHPGDMTTDCEPTDLQRRLRNLQRRDREWEEEQGLNVLFLAIGFLNWVDVDGERARSPLLLMPLQFGTRVPARPVSLSSRAMMTLSSTPRCAINSRSWGSNSRSFGNESTEDEPM